MSALRVVLLVLSAALLYMAETFGALAAGALGYWKPVVFIGVVALVLAIASLLVLMSANACGKRADRKHASGLVVVCPSVLVLLVLFICLALLLMMFDPEIRPLLATIRHPPIAFWRFLSGSTVPALALLVGVMLLRVDARPHDAFSRQDP